MATSRILVVLLFWCCFACGKEPDAAEQDGAAGLGGMGVAGAAGAAVTPAVAGGAGGAGTSLGPAGAASTQPSAGSGASVAGQGGAGGAGSAGTAGEGGSAGAAGATALPSSGEDSGAGCSIPALAAYSALTENDALPDPFTGMAGTRITTKDEWRCRRAELGAQAQEYELGAKPPKPDSVTGSIDGDTITVNVTHGGESISFSATVSLPSDGQAPYPAMIGIGGVSIGAQAIQQLGVATIRFDNDEIAAQSGGSSRGVGKFYSLYGADHSAGALIAWAWGVSRLIDVLESLPSSDIDATKLGVTGCSRNGKGALVVGAFDERIRLTIPQESGSGGTASWRVSDAQRAAGQNVQTLSQITGENVWFTRTFDQFGQSAARLPFDHHEMLGMVAPRGLLVIENTSMEWLGNVSCHTSAVVSHALWEALGVPDDMGVSQVGGHDHCLLPASQAPEVGAYVRKFLLDDASADTAIMRTDGGYTVDTARWVDWTTPVLQ